MSDYRLIEVDRYIVPNEPDSGKLCDYAVAYTNSLVNILHYASVYGQDGPVRIEEKIHGKWVEYRTPTMKGIEDE